MQHCDVGEKQTLRITFWNTDGDSTDPGAANITLTIKAPDGTVTTPVPVHDTLGAYHYVLDPTQAGIWLITWEGDGNGVDQRDTSELAVGIYRQAGPCEPWCSWEQVVRAGQPLGASLADIDAQGQQEAMDWATALLFGLTGSRYPGLCRSTFGICGCCRTRWCRWPRCTGSADHADLVDVGWPVWAVTDVYVDGALVPHASYRVDEMRYLLRLDGEPWPSCPDLAADPANAKATIIYGAAPFAGGDIAAANLAAFGVVSGAASCGGVPDDVIGLQREGVTYQLDPKEFEEGRTGLGAVDSWLAAEKASRRGRARLFDPARDVELERLGTDRGGDL